MRDQKHWRSLLLASSIISLATPALAQQEASRSTSSAEDDIVVVATRREAPLQDVSVAVTALGADQLALAQVTSLEDIGALTPNLIAVAGTAGGSRSSPVFSIRGQSQQERGGLVDGSVATYFGDVPFARTQGLNQNLYDIQAIEVIRGPVGTLFGRNATGGAVIIRPNLPDLEQVDFGVGATIAELGRQEYDGYVNLPLSDNFALRLGAGSTHSDGYIYDEALGRNINNENSWSVRASALAELGNVQNVFMWSHFNEDDGGSGGHARFLNFAATALPNGAGAAARNYPTPNGLQTIYNEQLPRGDYRIANGLAEFNRVQTTDLQNTTTVDLSDNLTLKGVLGYRIVDSHILVDLDGTRLPLLHSEILDDAEQFTGELQVLGQHGNLDWIAGAFYFHENGENNAGSISFGTDPGAIELSTTFATTGAINNRQQFDNTSYAVFAEFTYDLSQWLPGLSITAGGRQTWDEREATILNRNINGNCRFRIDDDNNPATAPITILGTDVRCRVDAAAEFDAFTYNLALNYMPDDDTLIYASLRRGFRSGGFSARATTDEGLRRPNDPEFVRTAEFGLKRDWRFGDAFLRTNLAVFHSDYTDIQRQVNDTTQVPSFSVIVNAAEATVQGAELEVLFRPIDRLELSGFWGYTDAQFDQFIDPFTLADLSGSQFARVPENTWRVAAALDLFSSPEIGDLTLRAAYSGRDEFIDTDTLENAAVQTIPSHEQLDMYLQWRGFLQSHVDVTFFVKNVEDNVEYQPLASVWSSLGFAAVVPGEPRTVGVQLRYDLN